MALELLVLGGTRFVGRALVEAALDRGHRVTTFNRGSSAPGLFGDRVEELHGDRSQDLSALGGRRWDAVVDVAAYHPADVSRSTAALQDAVGTYLFVSTISVYKDHRVASNEEAPVVTLESAEQGDDSSSETYGARKAACEDIVRSVLGSRACIVRPGLIVGPFDTTDRFGYWPRRICQGGRVLAPGAPTDPVQFIDVRDLAQFMVFLLERGTTGTFNATGHTMAFSELLACCQAVCGSGAELVWAPSAKLLEAGLDPWMGVPLWIGAEGWEAASHVNVDRAVAAGLSFRPLEETVRGALDSPLPPRLTEFTSEVERELLAHLS